MPIGDYIPRDDRFANVHTDLVALGALLDASDARRLWLAADVAAWRATRAEEQLHHVLAAREVRRLEVAMSNPTDADAECAGRSLTDSQADVILAFGGGTAIDIAKLALHRTLRDGGDRPTFIAIPTTAGTGSEATHFAVMYVNGCKQSVADAALLPDQVVLDPALTRDLPPAVTATTGLDAMCQSIESLWSVQSSAMSRADALLALKLAWRHLESAVLHPTPEDRAAMLAAAHLAGRAINVSKTTVCHALSYGIAQRYRLAHGLSVALTLGPVLRWLSRTPKDACTDPRGSAHLDLVIRAIATTMGAASADAAAERFRELLVGINFPASLAALGEAKHNDIDDLAAAVNHERLANTPRAMSPDDLHAILQAAL